MAKLTNSGPFGTIASNWALLNAARALMFDQDLSRYRLSRAISDEGWREPATCARDAMPLRVNPAARLEAQYARGRVRRAAPCDEGHTTQHSAAPSNERLDLVRHKTVRARLLTAV